MEGRDRVRGKSFFAGPFLCAARCFFSPSGGGSEELLSALGRCGQLEASHFGHIGLGQLSLRREPRLDYTPQLRFAFASTVSEHNRPPFFVSGGRQELNFEECDAIPDAAWKLLADGTWPRLRVAKGVPEEHLQRLCKAPLDLEGGSWEFVRWGRLQAALILSLLLALGSATSVERSAAHGVTALGTVIDACAATGSKTE